MKHILLIMLTFFGQLLIAQTFTEVTPTIPFDGVWGGDIEFADVDGDGDQDFLLTGVNASFLGIAKLYINDGVGNFTLKTGTSFEGAFGGHIDFADVDGDGDEDVLISGGDNFLGRMAKLYTNDGVGNFTEVMNTPFPGVAYSSQAFADVDGDGDQDVLITGADDNLIPIAKLYINDGMGNFTLKPATIFGRVWIGSVAFADVDGDNDQDVFITGKTSSGARIANLYMNGGSGNFTLATGSTFDGVSTSSLAFEDIDGDGDQDVLIAGWNGSSSVTTLYTNDGVGIFTKVINTSLEGISDGDIAFADVNGDGHQDVFISGENNTGTFISKLYTNGGTGNFTEVTGLPFEQVVQSAIAFADVNGDGDQDIFITGQSNVGARIAKLYTNDMLTSVSSVAEALPFEFMLYPNPARVDNVNVNYASEENGSLIIRVFDLTGRLVKEKKKRLEMGEQTFSIDISSLTKGAYFIQLDDGERKGTRRLFVL